MRIILMSLKNFYYTCKILLFSFIMFIALIIDIDFPLEDNEVSQRKTGQFKTTELNVQYICIL